MGDAVGRWRRELTQTPPPTPHPTPRPPRTLQAATALSDLESQLSNLQTEINEATVRDARSCHRRREAHTLAPLAA